MLGLDGVIDQQYIAAIRVLREGSSTATGARASNRLYDEAVRQALTVLWEAADRICGKRLKALIPMLVDAMERHGHLDLAPLIKTKVLHVSAATIDRVLAAARLHIDGAGQRRWALPAALPVRSPMQRSRAAARRQSEAVRDARAAASSLDLAAACHSAPDRTRGRRSQVLARPVRGLPQRARGRQRPVWLAKDLAPDEHQVGLAAAQHMVGLLGRGDEADRGGRDARFAPHPGGESRLETRPVLDRGRRHQTTRRHVDKIDAERAEPAAQLDRRLEVPAAVNPVGGRKSHQQRQSLGPLLANCGHDLSQQTRACREAAAIGVAAQVRQRRQELMQQESMGGMNLDGLEAGLARAPCARPELLDDLADLGRVSS
jgi:hypothetical protein